MCPFCVRSFVRACVRRAYVGVVTWCGVVYGSGVCESVSTIGPTTCALVRAPVQRWFRPALCEGLLETKEAMRMLAGVVTVRSTITSSCIAT